ncbi:MAG: hypothetical protein HZA72_00660 [Candidatus Omnitrophica bacterium]|nr:hypothetical protein [Candidatus Omnitrophota bacterium]
MAKASKVKEIIATTPNKVGMLAEITDVLAGTGVNILAICAYAMEGKAIFMMLTSDNSKAVSALKGKEIDVKESDAISVSLNNKVGAAKELAEKLSKAGVDLDYCYGSTGNGSEAILVLSAKDINKALAVCG